MTLTPEQIEAGMTRDEAISVAESAYSSGNLVTNDGYYEFDLEAAATVIQQAFAERDGEIERLRAALNKANGAHWFYYGDDCSSDMCRDSIDECIDEDFGWDNKPEGDHVLRISGARPVPDMWVALHYFTEAEKDARQDDEPYTFTVHKTADEARQALAAKGDSRG